MTGFTAEQRAIALFRDFDTCCLCGKRATVVNHRANRGAGGFVGANVLSNACALCWLCNDAIERDGPDADAARTAGVKLSRYDDPRLVPYMHPTFRCLVWPRDDGDFTLEAPCE